MIFTSTSLSQAKLKVAATLMFIGNLPTASSALPSYKIISLSAEIPNDSGDLRVIKLTLWIFPMDAALIPSNPIMAPKVHIF